MPFDRLPRRDPRTVARDIPGVLDVLFPRLTSGLVGSLNKTTFSFLNITPVPEDLINKIQLQKAMLFELSVAYAEDLLSDNNNPDWEQLLQTASQRQRRHYDAQIPDRLSDSDIAAASHAAHNLVTMLTNLRRQRPSTTLEHSPLIPGLGWIASGSGDFALGSTLIEVKHTDRNFRAGDIRQVLMYWLLKYARSIESSDNIWSHVVILNPRRNTALQMNYEHVLRSASAQLNPIELVELLRSAASQETDRR